LPTEDRAVLWVALLTAPVSFEVEVPHCTPAGATIYLRSNRLDAARF